MPESKLDQEQVVDPAVRDRLREKELARWVMDRWEEAETAAKQDGERDLWDQWITQYWGETPPGALPAHQQPVLTTELRDDILHEAAELTDGNVRVHVTGENVDDARRKDAEGILQGLWQTCEVNVRTLEALIWSAILPVGWLGCYWDPWERDGLGDVVVRAEDPRTILPGSTATDDRRWPMVLKEDWMDLYLVRDLFPDKGDFVRPDAPPAQAGKSFPRTKSSPYQGPMFAQPGSPQSPAVEQARIISCWVRDPSTKAVFDPGFDAQGMPMLRERHVKAYPRGRYIVASGDVILADDPWRNSSFPLFRVLWQPAIGTFWPPSIVRDLTPTQQAVDKGWEQIIENMDRVNHGLWFGTGEIGWDPENFAPVPGMCLEGAPGSSLEAKAPPPFPGSMLDAPERLASIMRRKLGRTEARSGGAVGGNVSQRLVETEIAQAEATSRMRAKMLGHTLRRLAQHMLETYALMYRTTRRVPFVETGGTVRETTWRPMDEEQALRLVAHIDPASLKPRSETLEKNLILALAKMGKVGTRYLLEELELPNKEAALKEMQEMMMLQAAMAAQKKGKRR